MPQEGEEGMTERRQKVVNAYDEAGDVREAGVRRTREG